MDKPQNPLYLKLGDNSTLFTDPANGIKVANKEVIMIDASMRKPKSKLSVAIANGHLVEAKEEEYTAWSKTSAEESQTAFEAEKARLTRKQALSPASIAAGSATSSALPVGTETGNKAEEEEDDDEDINNMTKSELLEYMKSHGFSADEQKTARGTQDPSKIVEQIQKGPQATK